MNGGGNPPSAVINRVREGFYLDSVALMRVAMHLEGLEGVETAALMIGTPSNKEILEEARLLTDEGRRATPRDLVIGLKIQPGFDPDALLDQAEDWLRQPFSRQAGAASWRPKMLRSALKSQPGSNLALISVPGAHAAAQARQALRSGLHVMIFSDNMPLAEEAALKAEARALGLLVMGPDCGTAIINGVPLAFSNHVPRGGIGIVSASGTGLQEVSSLLAQLGGGISHGIGTGGRDLYEAVGGITTLMALDALDADPDTHHLVLISKPPAPAVARRVVERLARSPKPCTICLLGAEPIQPAQLPPNVTQAHTLQEAAELAMGKRMPAWTPPESLLRDKARRPGSVRGLFAGGTLCAEAQTILLHAGLALRSNVPVPGAGKYTPGGNDGHLLLDLGADEYTLGRLHPMIDPKPRLALLGETLREPGVGVVLLDVVLGQGAHPDPAAGVAHTVLEAGGRSASDGSRPVVLASVTGTDGDPQGRAGQVETLRQAGILVAPSNAAAARVATQLVLRSGAEN